MKIRWDQLKNRANIGIFLSLLVKEGVLETYFETHDGRTDRVFVYPNATEHEIIQKLTNKEVNQE